MAFTEPKHTRRDTHKNQRPFFITENIRKPKPLKNIKNCFPQKRQILPKKELLARNELFSEVEFFEKRSHSAKRNNRRYFPHVLRKLSTIPQDQKVTEDVTQPRWRFRPRLRTAIFSQSMKNYGPQKLYRKTKVCLFHQQPIGLFEASCYTLVTQFATNENAY